MTTAPAAAKPRRHPVVRPLAVLMVCIAALIGSGFLYAATGWVWLGAVNGVLLLVGGAAFLWMVAVLVALGVGTLVGRTRRR